MRITDLAVDRPVTITMIVAVIVVVGLMSLSNLGLDLMPDVDFPTISVVTRYDGASSEDIERLLTRPVEGAVASVNGVAGVKSMSREDVSFVMVEFEWGTDLDSAADDLRQALSFIEPMMPEDAGDSMILKFSLGALPVLSYGVSGMGGNTIALREYVEDQLLARLERLDGVAGVILMGGAQREITVDVDRTALEATGLSLGQVTQAVASQNMDLPGGRVVEGRQEFILRTLGAYRDLADIRETAVGMARDGTPVRVRDVAVVAEGIKDLRNTIRMGGDESLYMMVNKQSGANPLQVASRVKAELAEIKQDLGGTLQFSLVMDTGQQIENMATNVSRTGLIGGLLAVLFMFFFLRSVRPTFAVAVAIPLSILATFIPIFLTGETLNLMTMGGLMLGVGMLVDNAVVVIENIFRHLEMGKSRKEAARIGAKEVGTAITASTLTTIAVFLPLYFGGGLAGELVRGLAVVVAFALASSLLVALTMVPMLASVLFNTADARRGNAMTARFDKLRAGYRALLRWVLERRKRVLVFVLLLLIGAGASIPLVGATFLPGSDVPIVMAMVKFPVGTPLDETNRALRRIEAFVKTFDDIETVGAMIGVNEDDLGAGLSEMSPSGVHEAQIFARLKADRAVTGTELLEKLRAGAPKTENMSLEFMDMGQAMMGGGGSKPIQIQIKGKELPELMRLAGRVTSAISGIEGLTEIDLSMQSAKPERHLAIDRERATSYGLSIAEVARAIETAAQGMPAGYFREGGDEFMIRVRYRPEDRNSFDAMDRIVIPTRAGFNVPLRQIASFQTGYGPVSITRKDQSRQVTVRANIEGRDLGTVMAEVQDTVGPLAAAMPPGYRVDYGGMYEEMVDAFIKLFAGLMLAILLVYMVMAGQFEAFVHPLVIMVTMPLSLIGVTAVLLLTGTPFSVVTFVGVIMLAGIVVNNGIVLIDHINQLRASGMERREAVIQGGSDRVRAVLITSGTTITGLLPMALIPGRGAELTADMALTVAGGLASATVLTLVIVPVVYEILDSAGAWARARVLRIVHNEDAGVPAVGTPILEG